MAAASIITTKQHIAAPHKILRLPNDLLLFKWLKIFGLPFFGLLSPSPFPFTWPPFPGFFLSTWGVPLFMCPSVPGFFFLTLEELVFLEEELVCLLCLLCWEETLAELSLVLLLFLCLDLFCDDKSSLPDMLGDDSPVSGGFPVCLSDMMRGAENKSRMGTTWVTYTLNVWMELLASLYFM